jgi:hypothetical protein
MSVMTKLQRQTGSGVCLKLQIGTLTFGIQVHVECISREYIYIHAMTYVEIRRDKLLAAGGKTWISISECPYSCDYTHVSVFSRAAAGILKASGFGCFRVGILVDIIIGSPTNVSLSSFRLATTICLTHSVISKSAICFNIRV